MFKKDNKGFTIIEVLIVLAIAGLILLIVFLAVPALQRNQRNNARNGDASKILATVNECLANRAGNPDNCNIAGELVENGGLDITTLNQLGTAALTGSGATATSTEIIVATAAPAANTNKFGGTPNYNTIYINFAATCDNATGEMEPDSANKRSYAAQYYKENGSNGVLTCIKS